LISTWNQEERKTNVRNSYFVRIYKIVNAWSRNAISCISRKLFYVGEALLEFSKHSCGQRLISTQSLNYCARKRKFRPTVDLCVLRVVERASTNEAIGNILFCRSRISQNGRESSRATWQMNMDISFGPLKSSRRQQARK